MVAQPTPPYSQGEGKSAPRSGFALGEWTLYEIVRDEHYLLSEQAGLLHDDLSRAPSSAKRGILLPAALRLARLSECLEDVRRALYPNEN